MLPSIQHQYLLVLRTTVSFIRTWLSTRTRSVGDVRDLEADTKHKIMTTPDRHDSLLFL